MIFLSPADPCQENMGNFNSNPNSMIYQAQENMGDYKLKTAEDYVVPEQLRMNTNKALRRILGQEEFVSHNTAEYCFTLFVTVMQAKRPLAV